MNLPTLAAALLALLIAPHTAAAQRIDLSGLPHRAGEEERLPAELVAQWAAGAFLENVVALTMGDLIVTEASDYAIYRVSPRGEVSVFNDDPLKPAGIAVDIDGTIVATGTDEADRPHVFVFAPDGEVTERIAVPGGRFLNGAAFLAPGVLLVADSAAGVIHRVGLDDGSVGVWLDHEALAQDPERSELIPGANGIKLRDGAAYVSNTSKLTMLRVPLLGENHGAGEPEVMAEDVLVDDFAIAADGAIFAATHIFDTVVRLDPDGSVTTVATAEDGVRGSTAMAFDRRAGLTGSLYVVGDGGVYLEPETAGPANVVRLDTGGAGLSLAASFAHVPYPGRLDAMPAILVTCFTAKGAGEARERTAPAYTRFLELIGPNVLIAGQVFGDGRDSAPTARRYLVGDEDAEAARAMMEASPYYTEGVYERCEAEAFEVMLGSLTGGVAWPDETSEAE